MRTPFEKLKKADKELKGVMVMCLLFGLFIIGFVLYLYLKHDFSNLWGKQLPVNEYELIIKATLVWAVWVLPSFGIFLVLVAYAIWNYRRKRGVIKEHDNPDA
jgi:H+/Cl- antiporter ClcA